MHSPLFGNPFAVWAGEMIQWVTYLQDQHEHVSFSRNHSPLGVVVFTCNRNVTTERGGKTGCSHQLAWHT